MASFIVNKGVTLSQVASVFFAIVPSFLELAVPMAALLGVMLTFGRLSGDSEIVVLRASGISFRQMLKPILLFGVLISVFALLIGVYLRPWGNDLLARTLFEIAKTRSSSGLDPGIFNKLGPVTLYSEEIGAKTGRLKHVMVDDQRKAEERKIIFANHGLISSDSSKQLIQVTLYNGEIHEEPNGNYVTTHFNQNEISFNVDELFPESGSQAEKKSQAMFLPELLENIELKRLAVRDIAAELSSLEEGAKNEDPSDEELEKRSQLDSQYREDQKSIRRFQIEFERKFSMPLACFVLAILALPLGVQPPRIQKSWGTSISALLAVAIFSSYYGILAFGMALAESGSLPARIALWLPNLICLCLAVFFYRQVSTERWHSMAHGFEVMFEAVSRRFRGMA